MHPGDRYVLCSDGLSTMLGDPQIQAIVAGNLRLDGAAQALVEAANAAGGRDNVTAVVIEAAGG